MSSFYLYNEQITVLTLHVYSYPKNIQKSNGCQWDKFFLYGRYILGYLALALCAMYDILR